MTANRPLTVTRPDLPPLEDFLPYLREIWDSRILSNGGPFHQRLEQALREYLGVPQISLFANATLALVTAMQALRIEGEVITTPYSFVATSHALMWNRIRPVFVDIDPETLNLDPSKIEAAITPQTTAIMPIHCYGTPCEVEAIRRIADDYDLKVVYDAAHAFGVQRQEEGAARSILNHGDLSILSFHATKVFNTFEGGAIISPDLRTKQRIDHLKNFGFVNETTVVAAGINGKMSEFNAALGLLQLERVDAAIRRRAEIDMLYRQLLAGLPGLRMPPAVAGATPNHSYFAIRIEPAFGATRDEVFTAFREEGVLVRRYFYPLISDFPMYRGLPSAAPEKLPVARQAAAQVLCLPIFPDMSDAEVLHVATILRRQARPSIGTAPGPLSALPVAA